MVSLWNFNSWEWAGILVEIPKPNPTGPVNNQEIGFKQKSRNNIQGWVGQVGETLS